MSSTALADLDGSGLWSVLRDAAAGGPGQIDTAVGERHGLADQVAALCASAGSPRLGWICPPPWPLAERGVTRVLAGLGQRVPHGILPLATGGWSFAARAVHETVRATRTAGLLAPLDSLRSATIRGALREAPDALLAISASRATFETRLLAAATAGGLDGTPLAWLSDEATAPDVFALSPRDVPDQVAMLGAPLSIAFLVAAAAADFAGLADAYARLLRDYDSIGLAAARRAAAADVRGRPVVRFVPPSWAGQGLRLWLLQLGRQVLCGKSGAFQPQVEVPGVTDLTDPPDLLAGSSRASQDLGGLMETLYSAGVFAGCLALHAGLAVAEHSHVSAYKNRLASAGREAGPLTVIPAAGLPEAAAGWLAGRPELTRLQVVRYDHAAGSAGVSRERFATATGRSVEVHAGSEWNHHSFHSSYADRTVAVLVVVPPPQISTTTDAVLAEAARAQRDIAVATHLALADRSMIVQLPPRHDQDGG